MIPSCRGDETGKQRRQQRRQSEREWRWARKLKTCKVALADNVLLYHHLFPAQLTRTHRSTVFCLLLPAEMTVLYANRQEARWRRAKCRCYCQRHSDRCTLQVTREVCCWAAATRADSTLCYEDRLYLLLVVTRLQSTQRLISVTSI